MGLRYLQSIFVANVAMLIRYAHSLGYELTFGDAYRDPLLAKINSGEYGLVEKATGKTEWVAKRGSKKSLHMSKVAIDFNLFKNGDYVSTTESHKVLGRFWETLHRYNRWGGRFRDGNHYEMVPHAWRDDNYKPL